MVSVRIHRFVQLLRSFSTNRKSFTAVTVKRVSLFRFCDSPLSHILTVLQRIPGSLTSAESETLEMKNVCFCVSVTVDTCDEHSRAELGSCVEERGSFRGQKLTGSLCLPFT